MCELDLVFNFNKVCLPPLERARAPSRGPRRTRFTPAPPPLQVYMILDEFFLAGEVQETSKQTILHRVQELDKLE